MKIISILLFVLILSGEFYTQTKKFGYRITGNADVISDVFFVQDGFVLDSARTIDLNTYRFEYDKQGKLKRDINFVKFPIIVNVGGRPRIIMLPGYRDYHYNERGDVDSISTGYNNDSLGVWVDSSSYRINYSYDNDGNILTKTYLSDGTISEIEENSYDSLGNLTLNKIIYDAQDTTYNIREYDSQNRLILTKTINSSSQSGDQNIYQYDSLGNINLTIQSLTSGSIYYSDFKYYLEFDKSGKLINEIQYRGFNTTDSTWSESYELLLNYDEYNRILKMGESSWFHYNEDGNLDSLVNTHLVSSGYLANRATFIDSYGNKITLPEYIGACNFYYSSITTAIEKEDANVENFTLAQNYPNPFNPTTTIVYSLPKSSLVKLEIYDLLGRKIATLVNEEKRSGTYKVTWNAGNIPSGVYFYKISVGGYSKTNKMILLK